VRVLAAGDAIPGGPHAIATPGDVLLENDQVSLVIDALEHPHHLAPTGGTILDLGTAGGNDDQLNQILQATGLLPEDTAKYTELEIIDTGAIKAVQVRGTLVGDSGHRIATRYEIRPCEPGVRVRTEVVNLGADPEPWSLTDGLFWGDRNIIPFTPIAGEGFDHPSFGLDTINDAFVDVPFVAAAGPIEPTAAAYAVVACDRDRISGFHSTRVSSAGTPRRVVRPGDYEVYERFIAVAPGRAIEPAARIARRIRGALWKEPTVTLTGRLVETGTAAIGAFDQEIRAALIISSAAATGKQKTPLTHVLPAADGSFSAALPPGQTLLLEVESFGRIVATETVSLGATDLDAGALAVPAPARVTVEVTVDGAPREAQVFFVPADGATRASASGRYRGQYDACAPLLGAPHGGTPACNRALVNGPTALLMPPGRWIAVATAGLFDSVDQTSIALRPGDRKTVRLAVSAIPGLVPPGALSADFHVHGSASFDSGLPDRSRVRAFLAASMDVIAATDHDAVSNYAQAMADLAVGSRIALMTGVETTALVLHHFVPGDKYPRVIGHWNFWPLRYDPTVLNRGVPPDELIEPGVLIDRLRAQGFDDSGVVQLNHPWSPSEFGRDLAFPRAIGLDPRKPLLDKDDGSAQALFNRTPPGAMSSNAAYHTQEVVNGSSNDYLLPFRALWFYLLGQGVVRAGVANSDSHGLTDSLLGTPRNLVFTAVDKAAFDAAAFNRDVKAGHLIGTNGPILEVTADEQQKGPRAPSVAPFVPAAGGALAIKLTAAPWVPIDEIRVVVNGALARTITELARPATPFGGDSLRFQGSIPLSEVLPAGNGDAWIVVEAGAKLPVAADLDCDGLPDTTDNNGDGVIDWRDVDQGAGKTGPLPACDSTTGPILGPKAPDDPSDPRFPFYVLTPRGYAFAFTNPLLLDRDGVPGFSGPDRGAKR
jgi:hypothetical protein